MDPVLAAALKKKAKLEKDLAEIDRFIALHRKFSAGVQADFELVLPLPEVARLVVARNNPIRPAVYVQAIERVLRRNGKPMTRAEITEAVQAEGFKIPSADKVRYIGTILWREGTKLNGKLEVIKGRYWLKNVKVPTDVEELINLVSPLSVGGNRT